MNMDKVDVKARGAKNNQSAGKKDAAVNNKMKSLPRKYKARGRRKNKPLPHKYVINGHKVTRSINNPILHYVRVGVTEGQYNELRAQAKAKKMPVSKMLRLMAFGNARNGSHNGVGMKRLDRLYESSNKELAYLVKHDNIVYYINRIAVNLNQCMRFLNTYGDDDKYAPMWVKRIAECSGKINEVLDDKVIKQVHGKQAEQNDKRS